MPSYVLDVFIIPLEFIDYHRTPWLGNVSQSDTHVKSIPSLKGEGAS